jgi:hypothetical protein
MLTLIAGCRWACFSRAIREAAADKAASSRNRAAGLRFIASRRSAGRFLPSDALPFHKRVMEESPTTRELTGYKRVYREQSEI